ncbi:protein of unknown function [Methylorubrum extorquens]|uniref:Tip attachment protein J domain-containing protein n=1 Tax=Methylorubrum extorquens TaxID=408 RepID=A0A2N9AHJ8_METEX|nr:protein of unknown function [Methylorubrum extorquens]
MVLTKRMTLGIGRFQIHAVHVGEAVFWTEGGGIQAPFTSTDGTFGTQIEFLYGQPSAIAPGDVISSPSVGGQEMPRPNGNPEWTPWFRLTPQGVTADAAQMSWTYPAIYRVSSQGRQAPTVAGVIFQAREINPNTGEVIGPEFVLHNSSEGVTALTTTPLRRSAYVRLPKNGAFQVRAQNAWPEAVGFEQKNAASWDEMAAIKDDVRVRPNTTEIVMRVRAGKGLTVTAFSEIWVDATRILSVWNGSAWVEQAERKAVWAFADLVRSQHGLALPNGFDADKAIYYHHLLDANDTFDGALPEVSSFWEAASEVLLPLRCDPVKVGPVHSFVRDESRAEPRHVLTRRQIVRDSAGATFKTKVEGGDVIVEFDRDGDPRRPDEVRFSYGPATRTPKRYRVKGIRDGLHALKHATWLAAVAVFRGAERRITTEWDGRLVFPGDHVLSDLWYLKGKRTFGVASAAGNMLTLDVTANVPAEWGYGSIRTREGREWGILRMRGVGARGLELHAEDVTALEARVHQTPNGPVRLRLTDVLARDSQGPTTVVIGDLVELQETYVARSAVPSDADHVQIEMVADDARVWQLLDEQVIAPAPINADSLAEPLIPQISVLHARCERIETGIEIVWGVSVTRGARNYEADISYDAGGTWEPLSPYGPASSGRAQMRQSDKPVVVRARAFGRTGLPGDYVDTTFTTVAPIVQGSLVDVSTIPPIPYEKLGPDAQGKIAAAQAAADAAQEAADAASQEATSALASAYGRLDDLRRALAADPSVRIGFVDAVMGDVRKDISLLTEATFRAARRRGDLARQPGRGRHRDPARRGPGAHRRSGAPGSRDRRAPDFTLRAGRCAQGSDRPLRLGPGQGRVWAGYRHQRRPCSPRCGGRDGLDAGDLGAVRRGECTSRHRRADHHRTGRGDRAAGDARGGERAGHPPDHGDDADLCRRGQHPQRRHRRRHERRRSAADGRNVGTDARLPRRANRGPVRARRPRRDRDLRQLRRGGSGRGRGVHALAHFPGRHGSAIR